MDASQYKDYVLSLLLIKYVSDKYAGQAFGTIKVPDGASFNDLVGLKGQPDIGDQINKKIIAPIIKANKSAAFRISMAITLALARPRSTRSPI
jgi:type I restriction enzyme M protein